MSSFLCSAFNSRGQIGRRNSYQPHGNMGRVTTRLKSKDANHELSVLNVGTVYQQQHHRSGMSTSCETESH